MDDNFVEICVVCNAGKILIFFTINIEKVKRVFLKESFKTIL